MTNNAAKYAFGVAAAGLVALFAHATVISGDDKSQALLFLGLFVTAAAVGWGAVASVGADVTPVPDADARTPIDPEDAPVPSYGPLITAIAAFVLVLGGAMGSSYVIAAIVVAIVGVAVWLFDSFRTVVAPEDAANVDTRLLGPLALPVFGVVLAITVAYSFSRVLLAISETASWVLAFIVAAVLLLVLTAIAERVPSSKVVAGVAGLGMLGVLAAGGAGAGVGEREFHHIDDGIPVVEIAAKDTTFDRNVIGLPADSDVQIIFSNFDTDVFHNVGIYTNEEPGAPVFNGKPSAKGTEVYKFRTPGPGTYRYICDFHPTMVGELRLEASTGAPAEEEHH
jgi:hypothetical protein